MYTILQILDRMAEQRKDIRKLGKQNAATNLRKLTLFQDFLF